MISMSRYNTFILLFLPGTTKTISNFFERRDRLVDIFRHISKTPNVPFSGSFIHWNLCQVHHCPQWKRWNFWVTPSFCLPSSQKALGLLGALQLKQICLRNFCRRDGRWRFINVTDIYIYIYDTFLLLCLRTTPTMVYHPYIIKPHNTYTRNPSPPQTYPHYIPLGYVTPTPFNHYEKKKSRQN